MKRYLSLLIVAMTVAQLAMAQTQAGGKPQKQAAPAPQEMGASKQIKQLADMTGTWKTSIKYKVDPSQPVWAEAAGSAKYEFVLDSCGIMGNFSGEFGELPLKGILVITFNRELGKYQCYWLFNTTGNPSLWEGTMDQDGALVFTGVDRVGGKPLYMRMTQRMPDQRSLVMSFEESNDGKVYKPSMEVAHIKQ